jgi:hypothetical protein
MDAFRRLNQHQRRLSLRITADMSGLPRLLRMSGSGTSVFDFLLLPGHIGESLHAGRKKSSVVEMDWFSTMSGTQGSEQVA